MAHTTEVQADVDKVFLKKMRYYVAELVSDAVADSMEFRSEYIIENMGRSLIVLLDLPAEPIKEVCGESRFEVPLTWFDHFRITYFPHLFTERFPIQYRTEVLKWSAEVGALYPKLPIAFPREKDMVIRYYKTAFEPSSSMRPEDF